MCARKIAILIAAVLLSACTMGPPVTQLSVASGAVTVAAPNGYCIDRSATRDRANGTFVLLGSCSALSPNGAEARVPVVLTALVSDPLQIATTPNAGTMAQFFKSNDGRAILSRSGQANTLRILQSETRRGILYMKLRDSSPGGDAALTAETWRAFLPLSDRITVLSVRMMADQPVSSDAALSVLRNFVAAVQTANPAGTGS